MKKVRWSYPTGNPNREMRFYTKLAIEQSDKTGRWMQSIVCKIANYGYFCMKAAWKIFFICLCEYQDANGLKSDWSKTV